VEHQQGVAGGSWRVLRIQSKKPLRRTTPRHLARGIASNPAVRALVEDVFAHQMEQIGLFVRAIGLDRARAQVGLA